jgi:hypothetical protein
VRDIGRFQPFAEKLRADPNAFKLAELCERHRAAASAAHATAPATAMRTKLRAVADHRPAVALPAIIALLAAESDDGEACRALRDTVQLANSEFAVHGLDPIEAADLPPTPGAWFEAGHWQAWSVANAFVVPNFKAAPALIRPEGYMLDKVWRTPLRRSRCLCWLSRGDTVNGF